MIKINRNRNCVYQIAYHVVWCSKYRKPILVGKIAEELGCQIDTICGDNDWFVIAKEIQPDHIHLFLTIPPAKAVATTLKLLKGISARRLFQKFPDLKQKLWGGHLWFPSYYVGTAGNVSETIEKYIQRTEHIRGRR